MRVTSVGHGIFAATLFALGIFSLVHGGVAPIWQDLPQSFPGREAVGYLCAIICVATGFGLLVERAAGAAARILLGFLLLWFLAFKARYIYLQPTVEGSYQSCGETAVLIAAAWVLYACLASDWDRQRLRFATGEQGIRIARVLYALAMFAFGLSHFAYLSLTVPLVPAWLPWHIGWAYFTGSAYLAAGVAILLDRYGRLAAALSVFQMGAITLLVWVPMLAVGAASSPTGNPWSEFVQSWVLTAAGWVVADSYRRIPWRVARSSPAACQGDTT